MSTMSFSSPSCRKASSNSASLLNLNRALATLRSEAARHDCNSSRSRTTLAESSCKMQRLSRNKFNLSMCTCSASRILAVLSPHRSSINSQNDKAPLKSTYASGATFRGIRDTTTESASTKPENCAGSACTDVSSCLALATLGSQCRWSSCNHSCTEALQLGLCTLRSGALLANTEVSSGLCKPASAALASCCCAHRVKASSSLPDSSSLSGGISMHKDKSSPPSSYTSSGPAPKRPSATAASLSGRFRTSAV
mmetsp:Transcript_41997/g.97799  ORF Transcript_41997/g.97799 Transcript_41997/m.97799 type:complete len:253 (+) Transcript_41997:1480-2238(+)